jgi:hypothetical protein
VGVVESVAAAIIDDRRRSGGSDGTVRRRLPQLRVSGVGGDGGARSDTWRRLMGRTRGPKIRGGFATNQNKGFACSQSIILQHSKGFIQQKNC